MYVRTSPPDAVARSTCLVSVNAIAAFDTAIASRSELLTPALKRLVAVAVIESVIPPLPTAGTATCTSSAALAPDANATGPAMTVSPPSSTPLAFTSRYTATVQACADTAATLKESTPLP